MNKTDETSFPYALLRALFLGFLALLILTFGVIAWYPRLCLGWGRAAMERGREDRAIRLLECSDTEEAQSLLTTLQTARAERWIAEGDYEGAQELLSELSITDPADERVAACLYGRALAAMDGEDHGAALDLLSAIPGYRDAAEQGRRCEKALARQAFEDGDRDTALLYVLKNPQDEDMRQIAVAIRLQAGIEDGYSLHFYSAHADMQHAQKHLMQMLRQREPGLEMRDMVSPNPGWSEHDAVQLLKKLTREYEPNIIRAWRMKKQAHD